MSSRALRRLQKQKEEAELDVLGLDTEEQPQKAFNAFSVLGGDDLESDNEDEQSEIAADEPPVEKKPVKTNKKSKKKKKKGKKKEEVKEEVTEPEDHDGVSDDHLSDAFEDIIEPEQYDDGDPDNEFGDDETLRDDDANFLNLTTKKLKASLPLLSVKTSKALDPDHELKNLFGNLSQETIDDANSTSSLAISPEVLAQFKKLASLTRGWGGKDRRSVPGTTRKLLMTKIRDDWLPTHRKSMTMKESEEDEIIEFSLYKDDIGIASQDFKKRADRERKMGIKYFKFEKATTSQDKAADSQFIASVKVMSDHDALIQQLQRHPYHVETLLQVAMILLRQGGDKATSNALVERCLFVFDRALHPKLHQLLLDGKSELIRLPYERYANRQFYLCLFRYIVALGERNLFLTALNYCKLLLGFSPGEDPVGVRYYIDFYAILSEEYEFLIEFADSYLVTCYDNWNTPGIAFSTALAHLRLGNHEKAKSQLKAAFLRHRYTAFRLAEQVQVSDVGVKESEVEANGRDILEAETYMIRSKMMWNDTQSIDFLRKELTELWTQHKPESRGFFSSWMRPSASQARLISTNLLRFSILSGEGSLMSKIPSEVWEGETFEYDLLPPQAPEGSKVVDHLEDYVHNLSEQLLAQLNIEDALSDID